MKTNTFALKMLQMYPETTQLRMALHSASFSSLTQTKFITSSEILPSITVFANVYLGNELGL